MKKKFDTHIVKGMSKDASVSTFNPELAFDVQNLRVGLNEENGIYTLSTFNGTGQSTISWQGEYRIRNNETILGVATIDNYLTLFTTYTNRGIQEDSIYKLEYRENTENFLGKLLYRGSLNFSASNPIETKVSKESEYTIKVYWIDGINPLRVINILATDEEIQQYSDSSFDALSKISFTNTPQITVNSSGGNFPTGVIQYIFTYCDDMGRESNIVNISPLYYTSMDNRGGSPEERSSNSFTIRLSGLNNVNYKYVNVYSVIRTSINSDVEAKFLGRYEITYKKTLLGGSYREWLEIQEEDKKNQEYLNEYQGMYAFTNLENINDLYFNIYWDDSTGLHYRSLDEVNGWNYFDFFEMSGWKLPKESSSVDMTGKYALDYYFPITTKANNKGEFTGEVATEAPNLPTKDGEVTTQRFYKFTPGKTALGGDANSYFVVRRIFDDISNCKFEYTIYNEYTKDGAIKNNPEFAGYSFSDIFADPSSLVSGEHYTLGVGQITFLYNPINNRVELPGDTSIYYDAYVEGAGNAYVAKKEDILPMVHFITSDTYNRETNTMNSYVEIAEPVIGMGYIGNQLTYSGIGVSGNRKLYIAVRSERIKNWFLYSGGATFYPITKNSSGGDSVYTVIGEVTSWVWQPKIKDNYFSKCLYCSVVPREYSGGTYFYKNRNSLPFSISPQDFREYPINDETAQTFYGITDFNQNADITAWGVEAYNAMWNIFNTSDGYIYPYKRSDNKELMTFPMPNVFTYIKEMKGVLHTEDTRVWDESYEINLTDTGAIGEIIDINSLLLHNKDVVIPYTMESKDNVLFLANYKTLNSTMSSSEDSSYNLETLKAELKKCRVTFGTKETNCVIEYREDNQEPYVYHSQLSHSSDDIKGFKYGETYRLGIQLINEYGREADIIFLGDYEVTTPPSMKYNSDLGADTLQKTYISVDISSINKRALKSLGFPYLRPVVIFPSLVDRTVIAQGVVSPTVFNVKDRFDHSPDVQSSWFFRPMIPVDINGTIRPYNITEGMKVSWAVGNVMIGEKEYEIRDKQEKGETGGSHVFRWRDLDRVYYRVSEADWSKGMQSNAAYIWCGPNKYLDCADFQAHYLYRNEETGAIASINNFNLAWAESRHWMPIPDHLSRNAEIQGIEWPDYDYFTVSGGYTYIEEQDTSTHVTVPVEDMQAYVDNRCNHFGIDCNVLTFHSPEIEWTDDLAGVDLNKCSIRIVGKVDIDGNIPYMTLTTSTPTGPIQPGGTETVIENSAAGFVPRLTETRNAYSWKYLMAQPCYFDTIATGGSKYGSFIIYPWHQSGSITDRNSGENSKYSILQSKYLSNKHYSKFPLYFNSNRIWTPHYDINGISIFDSDEVQLQKVGNLSYYGNIDKLYPVPVTKHGFSVNTGNKYGTLLEVEGRYDGYKALMGGKIKTAIVNGGANWGLNNEYYNNSNNYSPAGGFGSYFEDRESPTLPPNFEYSNIYGYAKNESGVNLTAGVRLQYKSTKHAIIGLGYSDNGYTDKERNYMEILPSWNMANRVDGASDSSLYNTKLGSGSGNGMSANYFYTSPYTHQIYQSNIISLPSDPTPQKGFLWLAEITQEPANRFGGSEESLLANTTWYTAGKVIDINTSNIIEWTEGDTYVQRYDCLKTYPFSEEAENNVIDIMSFMVETRVNIDGRYDRNRELSNNTTVRPTNFNQMNDVYSQDNNLFTNVYLSENIRRNKEYVNNIIWSTEKSYDSDNDPWINISTVSPYTSDTSLGPITSLNSLGEYIYVFQNNALGVLLFNNRVQVPVSDGTPIEISNGMKMQGIKYISKLVGTYNKWSIALANNSLYFVSSVDSSIYRISNEGLEDLDSKCGMTSWINSQDTTTIYNPSTDKGFRTIYDPTRGDVYFINNEAALLYSEKLQQFESFISLEGTGFGFNIGKDFFTTYKSNIWKHYSGQHNYIYNEYKDYSVTYISNPEFNLDKIFSNVLLRGSVWPSDKQDSDRYSVLPFNSIEVENDYQDASSTLTYSVLGRGLNGKYPSNTKKKFRVWGINIPRSSFNNRDRIRNMWAKITLKGTAGVGKQVSIYSMDTVYYTN